MKAVTLGEIEQLLDRKYQRCEALFKAGDMQGAARELYTEDTRYLTGDLRLLIGREAVVAFFEAIHAQIGEVRVHPVLTCGDPGTGLIYQFCNTTRYMAGTDQTSRGHYVAAFRRVGDDWLCEMEVPAAGWIAPLSQSPS